MSDRIFAYTVVLDDTYKDEDAEVIETAIRMVKGVLSVSPQVADSSTYFATEKARKDLASKIINVLYPDRGKKG